MLVFGVIITAIFVKRLRGEPVPTTGPALVSVAYIGFGTWAVMHSNDPFFFIFIVPGVLLALASIGGRQP
jgi:hypothetical protein